MRLAIRRAAGAILPRALPAGYPSGTMEVLMKRRAEREQAFILLFERTVNQETTEQIIENAALSRDMEISDFAMHIAKGVEANEAEIDAKIESSTLGWKINRLSKVSLALLRLAVYEMLYEADIPVSVSINEVIDLAKKYGVKEDASFINGVLGTVAQGLDKQDG